MSGVSPSALVRRPSAALQDGLTSHIERVSVDTDLALEQHGAYCAALEDAGYELCFVEDAPDLADAVYVEDTAVVVDDVAVLARPGAVERRDEVAGTKRVLRDLGLTLHEIEHPGTLDGGDVLQVGTTVTSVAVGGRTAQASPSSPGSWPHWAAPSCRSGSPTCSTSSPP